VFSDQKTRASLALGCLHLLKRNIQHLILFPVHVVKTPPLAFEDGEAVFSSSPAATSLGSLPSAVAGRSEARASLARPIGLAADIDQGLRCEGGDSE
jgi:hypothetical protein